MSQLRKYKRRLSRLFSPRALKHLARIVLPALYAAIMLAGFCFFLYGFVMLVTFAVVLPEANEDPFGYFVYLIAGGATSYIMFGGAGDFLAMLDDRFSDKP